MSMHHCEVCDNLVDTDWHDQCPICDHDVFGEESCEDPDCEWGCKEE